MVFLQECGLKNAPKEVYIYTYNCFHNSTQIVVLAMTFSVVEHELIVEV